MTMLLASFQAELAPIAALAPFIPAEWQRWLVIGAVVAYLADLLFSMRRVKADLKAIKDELPRLQTEINEAKAEAKDAAAKAQAAAERVTGYQTMFSQLHDAVMETHMLVLEAFKPSPRN